MSDAVHAKGCSREGERPSVVLDSYTYCPACQRMVRQNGDDHG